jgi:hypothetical protein
MKMNEKESNKMKFPPLFLAIILIILALSAATLYRAINSFLVGNFTDGTYLLMVGISTLALSLYMTFQRRGRKPELKLKPQKVTTTLLCEKCGFKKLRNFETGDYILKEMETCPKCDEKMEIVKIYREKTKDEKD